MLIEDHRVPQAAKMVNPDTKALMIVYDDAQAIYTGRKRPVWKQLGIEAADRTTVLKVNYRNTAQILRFARKFAADVIGAPGVCAGDESAILMPEPVQCVRPSTSSGQAYCTLLCYRLPA